MSNTTDLMTGASGLPEEPSAASALSGNVPDSAGRAGASPEPTGAVRSWPNTDDRAGQPLTAEASRRSGTGLSAMLLPELQRLAQSMGIQGTGRMRKGQVIAAIEERQRGGEAAQSGEAAHDGAGTGGAPAVERPVGGRTVAGRTAPGSQRADNDKTDQRRAPAGAGASRHFEQDAMEFETSQAGVGSASAGGIGDSSSGGGGAASIGGGDGAAGGAQAPAAATAAPAAGANDSVSQGSTQRDDVQPSGDGQRDRRRRPARKPPPPRQQQRQQQQPPG